MNIGVLTFPNSPSHGASLQMYALYHTLSHMGHNVEVINYMSEKVIHRQVSKPSLRARIVHSLSRLVVKSSKGSFQSFEREICKYPAQYIQTTEEIFNISKKYDRIIVGSDQVWNPVVTGNDYNFYLEFTDDSSKKATYAPSFGISKIDDSEKGKISRLLLDFSFLCAREKEGAQLIKELTGRDVPVVLDPTFLVSKNQWNNLKRNINLPKGKYVLFYTIKPSPKLKKFAQDFCDKNGYNLITVGGRLREFFDKNKHPVSGVGPGEFLSLIDGAEYVITNSFHGTAFSIIFNKNFYVEYSSDTNSRLTNIVNILHLEANVVHDDTLNKKPVVTDYESVNELLLIEKEKSISYLEEVVKE